MPHDKRQPFHKSILLLIPHASAEEMKVYAQILHYTLIPPTSTQEILRAWKRRCQEIKCSDHGIQTRFAL